MDTDDISSILHGGGVDANTIATLKAMDIPHNQFCFQCKLSIDGGLKGFQRHLSRPDHLPPYVCGQGTCLFEFMHRKSLYNHLRRQHAAPDPDPHPHQERQVIGETSSRREVVIEIDESSAAQEQLPDYMDTASPTDELSPSPVILTDAAERAVLQLRSITYMTSVAVQAVLKEVFTLMQTTASYLKEKVVSYLSKPEEMRDLDLLMDEFSLHDPFKHIMTKPQQISVFKSKYGLLEPTEIFIGHGFDSRLNPNRPVYEIRQVPKSFQYVSIVDILRSVMSNSFLRDLALNEKISDDGKLRSFKDGSLFGTLPPELKNALRIILYADDLEIVQALSPSAGIYKIAGIYFGIQNFPAELNAYLSYIFVTALAFADDAKCKKVWEPFLRDMRYLETQGIDVTVNGNLVNFKAVLVAQIGDSLAACSVLGFRNPTANMFCRHCYIKRQDMWQNGLRMGEPRNPHRHAQDVIAAGRSEANRTATGVDGPSMLEGLTFFETASHSVFDVFHDLLQGVNKMEVKLSLRHWVAVKKYFTLEELKSRIQFFDYGYVERKNKPNANFTEDYLKNVSSYNLHQSGAQMWCLTRAIPFLFGDLVPTDDAFMKLISLLNRIMTIVFAHAISESDLCMLDSLIQEHHQLFQQIFPGRPDTDAVNVPDGDEDVDDPATSSEQEEEEERLQEGFLDFDIPEDMDDNIVESSEEAAQEAENPAPKRRKKRPKIIRMINKHHHMLHYVDLIRKFGPLILYWCMRYEARHFFFKLVATVCHNYRNVLKTLMEMLQMKLAADKAESRSRLLMGKRGTKLMSVSVAPHSEQLRAIGLTDFSKIFRVNHVTYNGVDYRPQLFATVALQQVGSHPQFACIEAVYVSENQDYVYLLTKTWKTEHFDAKYCGFEVSPEDAAPLIIRQPSDLPMFRLMTRWKRYDSNKIYLVPRTIA